MVHFVGAGPGDPDLITVKGKNLISSADVIIYAGSLVNPVLLEFKQPSAEVYNSAGLTLPEVLAIIKEAESQHKTTVRLHTGDPSIYGAIQEQMDALKQLNIDYDVTPGVSSFLATAAALRQEYTLPGVSQTVIITRAPGRTAVPEKESLRLLASHQATMCIFLSVALLNEVTSELTAGGYAANTPVAVVAKASWPQEQIVRGTLSDIAAKVQSAGIDRTAMIVVGNCLGSDYELSKLYDPKFSHMFRQC